VGDERDVPVDEPPLLGVGERTADDEVDLKDGLRCERPRDRHDIMSGPIAYVEIGGYHASQGWKARFTACSTGFDMV
jgi:hypothetical protein